MKLTEQRQSIGVDCIPPLRTKEGVTLWRLIVSSLEKVIATGQLRPGEPIPTEKALAAHFNVNRHTVRRAVEELEARGLITVQQGRGSFVTEDMLDYPLNARTRFTETIRRLNREPAAHFFRISEVAADLGIANQLLIRQGRLVVLAERVNSVDGRPVAVSRHWFPVSRFPDIATQLAERPSVTEALAAFGVSDYRRKATRVTARLPTPEEAQLLQQPPNKPVLVTEAVNFDQDDKPVEVSSGCYPSGRVTLVAEPPGHEPQSSVSHDQGGLRSNNLKMAAWL